MFSKNCSRTISDLKEGGPRPPTAGRWSAISTNERISRTTLIAPFADSLISRKVGHHERCYFIRASQSGRSPKYRRGPRQGELRCFRRIVRGRFPILKKAAPDPPQREGGRRYPRTNG